jgi:hypothetical protein
MSREAYEGLQKRIADQHKSMGKEVNSRDIQKQAQKTAEKVDRRNGSKR